MELLHIQGFTALLLNKQKLAHQIISPSTACSLNWGGGEARIVFQHSTVGHKFKMIVTINLSRSSLKTGAYCSFSELLKLV